MNKWVVVCDICKKDVETDKPHYEVMARRYSFHEKTGKQPTSSRTIDACYQCAETHFHELVK